VLSPHLASAAGALVSLLLLVWLYRLASRPLDDRPALASALTVALVLSPHLYVYDLGLLVVPFALLYPSLTDSARGGTLRGAVGLVYISCFVGTFISMASVKWTSAHLGHGAALQLGAVAILIAAGVTSRTKKSPPQLSPS